MKKWVLFLLLIGVKPLTGWGQNSQGETYFKASSDIARLSLTGPSYEDFITYGDVLRFNAGLYYNPVGAIRGLKDDYGLPLESHRKAPAFSTLLASTDQRSGLLAPPDKASFLSHVYPLVGIQLIGKGGKYTDRFGSETTRMTYFEIPLYAMYGYQLSKKKGQLFGGLGFYFAYGLWGKSTYSGKSYNETLPAFDKNTGYKRFDAGLNFMVGYQLPQHLRLSLEYEHGLVNIVPVAGSDKTRNRLLSLNVAYPLKKITDKLRKK